MLACFEFRIEKTRVYAKNGFHSAGSHFCWAAVSGLERIELATTFRGGAPAAGQLNPNAHNPTAMYRNARTRPWIKCCTPRREASDERTLRLPLPPRLGRRADYTRARGLCQFTRTAVATPKTFPVLLRRHKVNINIRLHFNRLAVQQVGLVLPLPHRVGGRAR